MTHLLTAAAAAALALLLGACAHRSPGAPAAQNHGRAGSVPEPDPVPGASELDAEIALIQAEMALLRAKAALATPLGTVSADADPPGHPTHPARNRQLVVPSGPVRPELGRPAEMNALFLLAAGEGPKPTLLLLHGLPGNERNLDLAQAVRRAGWNVLTFTYRGAWGSEGTFSIQHAVADSEAALAFLRSAQAVSSYDVDPARIVVAGHSMGGYMAAHLAATSSRLAHPFELGMTEAQRSSLAQRPAGEGPPVAGLILLDAWDIAADARGLRGAGAAGREAFLRGFDDIGRALGPITAADIYDDLMRRGTDWDLAALAPALARTKVLTVYATHGGAERNRALAGAIGRSCPMSVVVPKCVDITAVELNTDHAFADHRLALAREVVGWLERLRAECASLSGGARGTASIVDGKRDRAPKATICPGVTERSIRKPQ